VEAEAATTGTVKASMPVPPAINAAAIIVFRISFTPYGVLRAENPLSIPR
jgi:hypothetical protein